MRWTTIPVVAAAAMMTGCVYSHGYDDYGYDDYGYAPGYVVGSYGYYDRHRPVYHNHYYGQGHGGGHDRHHYDKGHGGGHERHHPRDQHGKRRDDGDRRRHAGTPGDRDGGRRYDDDRPQQRRDAPGDVRGPRGGGVGVAPIPGAGGPRDRRR